MPRASRRRCGRFCPAARHRGAGHDAHAADVQQPIESAAGPNATPPHPAASTANPFTSGAGGGGNTGNVTIQADIASNALIIMGPEPIYNNLRAIIDRLDVRRAQVFVEALIVEVTSDKAAQFGIQWQVLQGLNKQNVQGFGGTNFGAPDSGNNIVSGSVNLSNLGQGLNLGILNGTIAIPGLGVITNLALLIRSLEQDANANILSTPTLLTLDNEEARIIVGQNIPFVTGQYATTGSTSTVTPFQTFERHDVGVLLRVKPQITEGGTIRLNIYQEVSRVESVTSTTGIVLSKRALESTVSVNDSADRRAGRPHPGQPEQRHRQAAGGGRHSGPGPAVPLRPAAANQDEPAGVHQAVGGAHRRARPRADVRALRLHHEPAGNEPRQAVVVLGRPDSPCAAA